MSQAELDKLTRSHYEAGFPTQVDTETLPPGPNAWRPAHIQFSAFGEAFAQRLITQMYFEGDPLIWRCPIVGAIADRKAVERLIAPLDMEHAVPMDSLAYRFDITLRGRDQTLFENRMEGL